MAIIAHIITVTIDAPAGEAWRAAAGSRALGGSHLFRCVACWPA